MMAEKHSFISYVKGTRTFNLLIDTFNFISGWFVSVKISAIKIIVNSVLLVTLFGSTLKISPIKIIINNNLVKLRIRLVQTLKVQKILITPTMHLSEKWANTITVKPIILTSVLRSIIRVMDGIFHVSKVKIVVNPLVGDFYYLSDYDGDYLTTMDSSNLIDLDYLPVP
jgi:hypothetical protein